MSTTCVASALADGGNFGVDAAFIAQEQGSGPQVTRLAQKAVVLTASPLLRADERAGIINRIQSNGQVAAAVK